MVCRYGDGGNSRVASVMRGNTGVACVLGSRLGIAGISVEAIFLLRATLGLLVCRAPIYGMKDRTANSRY